jgi:uncharacterized membrane protein HdeD (DUF308 family)
MSQSTLGNLDGTGFTRQFAEGRWWLAGVGAFLIIAGISALAFPVFASLAVEAVVGWAFILAGLSQLLYAIRSAGWGGFAWQALLGAVFLVGGEVSRS